MKTALLMSCAILAFDHPESCPVVLVKDEDGNALRINQSDYDANPDAWELFDVHVATTSDPAPAVVSAATTNAAPAQMVVGKQGTGENAKYYAIDNATQQKVEGVEGIDSDGYATEAEAWGAIMAKTAAPQG